MFCRRTGLSHYYQRVANAPKLFVSSFFAGNGKILGTVVGAAGEALKYASVQITSSNWYFAAELVSDQNGRFTAPGLSAGNYLVIARAHGRLSPFSTVTVKSGQESKVAVKFGHLAAGETEVYLSLEAAPQTIFPGADSVERKDVRVDDQFRDRMQALIGQDEPSIWEPFYMGFVVHKAGQVIGYAVTC